MKHLAMLAGILVLAVCGGVLADDTPSFKIKGDFRYRHEMIEKEDTKTRTRHRLRARVNIEGKINDEAKVVVGLSSGSDDPVSNNQSLGSGWSSKDVVLDVAFVEYAWKKAPGLTLMGGKLYNPFYKPGKSELIWDSDIRQEGMVARYKKVMDAVTINLLGTGLWIEERKTDKDSYLLAGQGVMGYHIPESEVTFNVGGSYYLYENSKGYAPYFGDEAGNTLADDTTYAHEYEMVEVLADVKFKLDQIPVTVMGNYVTNTAADSLNDGWLVGVRLGKTKKPGSWNARYIYREIKRDAAVGIYVDSDFIGGGTDGKGHEMGVSYQLAEKTTLAATYFINTIGLEDDAGKDFNRLQLDAKFKF